MNNTERAKMLIVDDRPQNLMALEAVLEPLNVELVRANSGVEALRCLLNQDFALILLDAQMPDMDGYETAALIRRRQRSAATPIIFITAIDKSETQVFRGYSAGAVDFIFKPFDPDMLRSKVRVFIEIYSRRRQAELQAEQLRMSEERFALAAAGTADGIWDWDLKTNRVFYSPRWIQIAGASGGPISDRIEEWLDRVDAADRERVRRLLQDHLEGRSEHFESEHRLADPVEPRWILCRGLAVRDAQGRAVRMAGSISDIRKRKQAEAELRRAERLAAIGVANANIAHSMKNIFMAIQGGLSIMRKMIAQPSDELREISDIVDSSLRRLHMMIMNMLDYSKDREILRDRIACRAIFEDLRRMLASSAEKRRARLEFEVEEDAAEFYQDYDRLLRCLLNLGVNAIDALQDDNGIIRFSARMQKMNAHRLNDFAGKSLSGPVLIIEVSDNGSGISEDIREKIFEPFFSTKASKGTGLGLSSVQQFVQESNGLLELDTEVGRGTTFRLIFFKATENEADQSRNTADFQELARQSGT